MHTVVFIELSYISQTVTERAPRIIFINKGRNSVYERRPSLLVRLFGYGNMVDFY